MASSLAKKAWLGLIGAALAYEAVVIAKKQGGETLSEGMWDLNKNYPYIPFLAGFLAGHLFWRNAKDTPGA